MYTDPCQQSCKKVVHTHCMVVRARLHFHIQGGDKVVEGECLGCDKVVYNNLAVRLYLLKTLTVSIQGTDKVDAGLGQGCHNHVNNLVTALWHKVVTITNSLVHTVHCKTYYLVVHVNSTPQM